MTAKPLSIAVIGAGMGGLTSAAMLVKSGFSVRVYEQATRFARVGAGIQMLPNSTRVLRRIGLLERLRATSFAPRTHLNREWDTGEIASELPMPEERYGAPYLCMHRGDLHSALLSAIPDGIVELNRRLEGFDQNGDEVVLHFQDGSTASANVVIGADGLHSTVRGLVLGPDSPTFTGRVAYRGVFPASLLNDHDLGPSRTKWWGIDRHIVIYYTTSTRDEVYFVTSVPEAAEWLTPESWSARGDVDELRSAFAGFHDDVVAVLEACPDCHKWAILDRDPLPTWSEGNVVLLGDACHPMTPYMAQGAATSMEDAVVLTRCLAKLGADDVRGALRLYEAVRKPRTSRIQAISRANSWMRRGESDTGWLYGYDAQPCP